MTQQASVGSVNQDGLPEWWRVYLQHRYAVLFYSLLLTLVGAPILKSIGMPGTGMQVFLGLNLLAAALPADSRKGRWVLPAILLAAIRADGRTTVRELVATRDHTERMLRARGIDVRRETTGKSG